MPPASPTYPLLAIDASSQKTWVGLKQSADALAFLESNEDPSKNLFELIERLLDDCGTELQAIRSIAYCEGPGSMLGVRTVVMAIRAWEGIGLPAARNLFAFNSLRLGRELLRQVKSCHPNGLVVTDARRSAWNTLPMDGSTDLRIVENAELEKEDRPLYTFEAFKRWTPTKAEMRTEPYSPEKLFATDAFTACLRPTAQAEPLQLRASEYKKWTPMVHRKSEA